MKKVYSNQSGVSLLSLLLALGIAAFLYYSVVRKYLSKSPAGRDSVEALKEENIDLDNYKSMQETSRKNIDELNRKIEEHEKRSMGPE